MCKEAELLGGLLYSSVAASRHLEFVVDRNV